MAVSPFSNGDIQKVYCHAGPAAIAVIRSVRREWISFCARFFFWLSKGKADKFMCNICRLHVLRESNLVSGRLFRLAGLQESFILQCFDDDLDVIF